MRKLLLSLLSLFLLQNICYSRDIVQFDFPNEGWHKVVSPDGLETKKCFVPCNQTAENYTEMLVFYERVLKNKDITPMSIMHRQLGKDRLNYIDIEPEYIKQDYYDAMITWCSKLKGTCVVERAFQGNDGVVIVKYINKMPHYSQNMFGQWSNILSTVKIYNSQQSENVKVNTIQL